MKMTLKFALSIIFLVAFRSSAWADGGPRRVLRTHQSQTINRAAKETRSERVAKLISHKSAVGGSLPPLDLRDALRRAIICKRITAKHVEIIDVLLRQHVKSEFKPSLAAELFDATRAAAAEADATRAERRAKVMHLLFAAGASAYDPTFQIAIDYDSRAALAQLVVGAKAEFEREQAAEKSIKEKLSAQKRYESLLMNAWLHANEHKEGRKALADFLLPLLPQRIDILPRAATSK